MAQSQSQPTLYIRRATPADAPALSRICLLTGDAGQSAAGLHTLPELPGLVYALPYVHVAHTAGFVLCEQREGAGAGVGGAREATRSDEGRPAEGATPKEDEGSKLTEAEGEGEKERETEGEEIVGGYILLALDSRAFEAAAESTWYPPLRLKYPLPSSATNPTGHTYAPALTPADTHYVNTIHAPHPALDACLAVSPAHMHIDLLPAYQRKGWGRRLIGEALRYMRDERGLEAVWLGMDERNTEAAKFYKRLGFRHVEGAPETCVYLRFEEWEEPVAGKGASA